MDYEKVKRGEYKDDEWEGYYKWVGKDAIYLSKHPSYLDARRKREE